VFLSYARRDKGIVQVFALVIWATTGERPWRDDESIRPGLPWREEIKSNISTCRKLVLFWCYHSKDSQEVRREYWQAISEDKEIVQIRLDGTDLARELSAYQAIDASGVTRVSHTLMAIERVAWMSGLASLAAGALLYALA
jgi:hypothetical protein